MAKNEEFELPHPRENAIMIGQTEAQQRFVEEFVQGKPHHAYLITGAKGIGKATLAYRFARYVLGQGTQAVKVVEAQNFSLFGDTVFSPATTHDLPSANANPLDMDSDNSLFRRISAGSHTDLLTLSPAFDTKKNVEKNIITVEDARQVPAFLSLTPAEGVWRVVIIDAVDQMNDNAANALLKILEEPPACAMLFLVCHQPAAILSTIRSRCRTLSLKIPNATEFSAVLSKLAPTIPAHHYTAFYGLSYGSPGFAMALYQKNALKWYEDWLNAMQPDASQNTRQKFADSVSAVKSPDGWDAIIHCWNVAMHRLTLYPYYDAATAILYNEAELLNIIANGVSPLLRARWVEEGTRLIYQTQTFNLDKRQTIRLLVDVAQLDRLTA